MTLLRVKQNRVPVFLYRNQGGTADIPSLFLGEWISFFYEIFSKGDYDHGYEGKTSGTGRGSQKAD